MNRESLFALIVAALFGMLLPSMASALGTPDNFPPPMETICDNEKGAAYGLCNAYCEAMDCDDPEPDASVTACQKVSGKYSQLTGDQLPCENTCPLNDEKAFPYFFQAVNGIVPLDDCERISNTGDGSTGLVFVFGSNLDGVSSTAGVWITPQDLYSGGDSASPTTNHLSQDQYSSCLGLLEDAITANMLICRIDE